MQVFARKKFFPFMVWAFNLFFLLCNRIYEGYSFSIFGWVLYSNVGFLFILVALIANTLFFFSLYPRPQFEYLDNFRGTFRWHICFNFGICFILENISSLLCWKNTVSLLYNFDAVVLRMISFGYDYHWGQLDSHFDLEVSSLSWLGSFVRENGEC